MKIAFRTWRWNLAAAALLACSASAGLAQQPLNAAKVSGPVAAPPVEREPTPAAPLPGASAPAAEAQAPAAPAPLPAEQTADPIPPAPPSPLPLATPPNPSPAPAGRPPLTTLAPLESGEEAAPSDEVVELVKERYPSGAVKIEREVTQDGAGNYLLHGAWKQFDERGRLIIDGRLVRNHKEGLWRRFYRGDESALLATAPYNSFTAPFISSATFHADVLHGKWTISDSKQRLVHELEFLGGERHGKATWYYPNGAVALAALYEHGRVNGDVTQFAADGSVAAKESYQLGRKLAPKVEYYDENRQVKKQDVVYLH